MDSKILETSPIIVAYWGRSSIKKAPTKTSKHTSQTQISTVSYSISMKKYFWITFAVNKNKQMAIIMYMKGL